MRITTSQHEHLHISLDFETSAMSIEELIVEYLYREGQVTFVDLEDDIPGFAGDLSVRASSNRNLIHWRGVSSAAVHALCKLQNAGSVCLTEVSRQTYVDKGKVLHLPVSAGMKSAAVRWKPVLVQLTESMMRLLDNQTDSSADDLETDSVNDVESDLSMVLDAPFHGF